MISILNIPKIPQVTAKLGAMRKPQEFLPHRTANGTVVVQSDKSIGTLDLSTGQGRFTTKGCYFPHLALAEPFTFPAEFVEAVKRAVAIFDSYNGGQP